MPYWDCGCVAVSCRLTARGVGINPSKAHIWPQANHVLRHGKCGVLGNHPDVTMNSKAYPKPHPDAIAEGDVGYWAVDDVTHQAVLCLKHLQKTQHVAAQRVCMEMLLLAA